MALDEASRIGTVAAVASDTVTIELDPSVTGMVKASPSGVIGVGRINSYLAIPAGHCTIMAVITAVKISQDSALDGDTGVRRVIEAVMVGRFESGAYEAGVSTFPSLFEPVSPATEQQIAEMFDPHDIAIGLGDSVVSPGLEVRLDARSLLARHTAILGTTGAGKSCTVTALLDGVLELDVPFANIIVLDANGEYAHAFAGSTTRATRANAVVIGPEPGAADGLFVPHWFMDNEDHLALMQASGLTQAPILLRSVADARLVSAENMGFAAQLRYAKQNVDGLVELSVTSPGKRPQEVVHNVCTRLRSDLRNFAGSTDGDESTFWTKMANQADQLDDLALDPRKWEEPVGLRDQTEIRRVADELQLSIRDEVDRLGLATSSSEADFDVPSYYELAALYDTYLPNRMASASLDDPKIRNFVAPLMMRLSGLLSDSRYNFLTRVPQYADALGRYFRYILGWDPLGGCSSGDAPPWADAYRRQYQPSDEALRHSVTIVDLSLIASDVLENVTGLLARLILGFAQRVEPRGSLPILIVLEEAHRYVPAHSDHSVSRSAVAFDRIAREGRKFGVSLLLSSQRPSELSRTVLSQCGTLIAHRMVNPDDQDLVRHATPFAAREVLRQLPGLATQHAIVLGEAVPAPSYVRVRHVQDPPRSTDPDFIAAWQNGPSVPGETLIDDISRNWTATTQHTDATMARRAEDDRARPPTQGSDDLPF